MVVHLATGFGPLSNRRPTRQELQEMVQALERDKTTLIQDQAGLQGGFAILSCRVYCSIERMLAWQLMLAISCVPSNQGQYGPVQFEGFGLRWSAFPMKTRRQEHLLGHPICDSVANLFTARRSLSSGCASEWPGPCTGAKYGERGMGLFSGGSQMAVGQNQWYHFG